MFGKKDLDKWIIFIGPFSSTTYLTLLIIFSTINNQPVGGRCHLAMKSYYQRGGIKGYAKKSIHSYY